MQLAVDGSNTPNIWCVAKYPGATKLRRNKTIPNSVHAPKPFRLAELYLIAAESAAMSGDDAGAATMLNTLRTSRGLGAVTTTGDALKKDIQEERTRELLFEGYRIVDLRRWGLPCKRMTPQNENLLVTSHTRLDKPASDPKFTWGIPQNDITTNPNLVQNPGW